MKEVEIHDEQVELLQAGYRPWWDVCEGRLISAATVYLPQGCPDWGERNGIRNQLCTFCSIPLAVSQYRNAFYDGKIIPQEHHVELFRRALQDTVEGGSGQMPIHTLFIFNGGSFLSQEANHRDTQRAIMEMVTEYPSIRRVVIESRAEIVTHHGVEELLKVLAPHDIALTVRIGIETQNDVLRQSILRKGHKRPHVVDAVSILKQLDVTVGGYVLLKPAPKDGLLKAMGRSEASDEEIDLWCIDEAVKTFDWLLMEESGGLGMHEAYFCSTNVGPGSVLEMHWRAHAFQPANLWMVYEALRRGVEKYGPKVHLLPFEEEPEFLAIPSAVEPQGISQNLSQAHDLDQRFHGMLKRYMQSSDADLLEAPDDPNRPEWYKSICAR